MKLRALLTIILSLLIGFILGFITPGLLKRQDVKKKHHHSYKEIFIYKTIEVINPSESQKDSILPIIEDYAQKTIELKDIASNTLDSLIHRMHGDLKPYITEKQFNNLEESYKKLQQKFKRK
jgi:hypothetical protein